VTVNSAGQLVNSSPTGLAAVLRSRSARDGMGVAVGASKPQRSWSSPFPGLVCVSCASRTPEQLAAWARTAVAPPALAGMHFVVMGVVAGQGEVKYPRYEQIRVFGTLEDYLAEALHLSGRDGAYTRLLGTDRSGVEDDWAHWSGTVTPELAAALEATAGSFRGFDGTAEDVLSAVTALLTPAACTAAAR